MELKLLPNETRRLDVAALQASGLLPEKAFWTSVTVTTDTAPDELVAVAASFDESLNYGAQTPFNDQLSFRWEGGMWEYDAYHSSIITAGNGGTKPMQAAFTIFYNQGTEKYELEQTLHPDEQMWIDVGKLIREHVPDKNGKTLPADLTMGSYEFRDLTNVPLGSLFEGKVIYDKTYGHVSYGCAGCCGNGSAYLTYNPLGIPFLSGAGNGVNAPDNCGGVDNVSSSFFGNGSTASTSIATVDYYATHSAVAVGSTTSSTHGYLPHTLRYSCPLYQQGASGGDNVNPLTPVQHNYPGNPLPQACWISQFFDHVTNGKAHKAQDVVNSNSNSNGGLKPAYGTPVYAAEAGTVDKIATGNPPAAQAYPACAGQGVPANYVKIKGADGYYTVYVHVTPTVAVNTQVSQGQQIGVTDNSGCQSGGHIHMRRTDPSGNPVNFTIPCVNKLPTNSLADGLVNDDVPDNI